MTAPIALSWHDVGPSSGLGEGDRQTVMVGPVAVALVRVSGVAYALGDSCPHRGGSLGQGDLQGTHLFCPLHGWSFDVRTGHAFFPKGARVACHRVEERDGRLYVEG